MKKIISFILFYTLFVYSQTESSAIKSRIDSVLSDPFFQATIGAVDVYDLTSHETLYTKNEKLLLHPASNMKILTTSTALLNLDSNYQFTTPVCYSGIILNKILYGDLYLVGRGDPLLKTSDLDLLVNSIKGTGIKEITGNIYADISWKDSLIQGSGWMWDDEASTDAPFLSALNINENSVQVFVSPTVPGEKAKIYLNPETGFFKIENGTITTPQNGINDYLVTRDWINRENTIEVSGQVRNRIIIDSSKVWEGINVFNPPLYCATLFYERFIKAGIKVGGFPDIKTSPSSAVYLNSVKHSLDSVIVNVNKPSYNLGAEMLLYALAEKNAGLPVTADSGVVLIKNMVSLIGLNPGNYKFADGSGVSRYNLVSAELLIQILKYFYENKPELYLKLYNSFPIAGVDGTLKRRMKGTPAENNVHAKTGTLNGVSALSGYLKSKNNHDLAFSILIQNYTGRSIPAKHFEDMICEILADYK